MKNLFNVTTVLPHNLLQTNLCIHHNFSTHVFRKCAAQLHYVAQLRAHIVKWQHWTKALVCFDDGISAFHSCVVDLWQSLSQWYLLLFVCVLVCRRENFGV